MSSWVIHIIIMGDAIVMLCMHNITHGDIVCFMAVLAHLHIRGCI
jgi:hypothetical protein